jgi:hypothetical protein
MPVARTEVAVTVQPSVGTSLHPVIEGVVALTDSFSVTTSTDTTAVFYCGGAIPLRLLNNSGGAITLTIYDAVTLNGVANDVKDEDGMAWGPFTLADGESRALPSGGMGITYAVVKGSAAVSGIRCKLGR